MAYDLIDPIGERRGDLQAAMICTTLANIHRDPAQKSEPYQVEDFVLKFGPVFDEEEEFQPRHSPDEIYAGIRTWALMKRNRGAA